MEAVLTQMDSFCTGAGRASQLGCYVQRRGCPFLLVFLFEKR